MSSQENLGSVENMYEETQVEWKIADFCKIAENGNFRLCNTPTFSFANSSWYFQLYPKSSVDPECTDFYLDCSGGVRSEYSVEYTLGLKRVDNSVEHLFTGIVRKGEIFGSRNSIKRSEVIQRKCELLTADVLTITCTLKHGTIHSTQPKHEPTVKKLIKLDVLSENLKDLSTNKDSCDTVLQVKDKKFKAHKAILMARSSVFAAMFQHDTLEKQTGFIDIPDCNPESFQGFLNYLYCGKLESISYSSAFQLYITSNKYDVQQLKEYCVEYLIESLTADNVCDIVKFADKYDDGKLLPAAQDFFNENWSKIFVTTEWQIFLKNEYRLVNKLLIELSKAKGS